MPMTKKDFNEIADALAAAEDWAKEMSAEQVRQALGHRLMHICQVSYTGSYGFDTARFKRVAKLDD